MNGSRKDLEKITRDNGLTWLQVFDAKDGDVLIRELYNVRGVPDHYLIDREGKIAARHVREKDLEQELAALLNQ